MTAWVVYRPDICDVHNICQMDRSGIVAKIAGLKNLLNFIRIFSPKSFYYAQGIK